MSTKNLLLALGLSMKFLLVESYFRMECFGRISRERLDPIVSPGGVSGHVHTISGGNAFSATYSYQASRKSTCSSCTVKQDLSNYWTPELYAKNKDGTFSVVPIYKDAEDNGGMTIYYHYEPDYESFPEGFHMIAGDPWKRNFTGDVASRALQFWCDGGNLPNDTWGIPNVNCKERLQVKFNFPGCWNGKDVAPEDGRSHIRYPIGTDPRAGDCPTGFEHRVPTIFFEVNYDVNQFADEWEGDQHPFVFAHGDTTGYGFHGDFTNAWDISALDTTIKSCNNHSAWGAISACPVLQEFESEESRACKIQPSVNEDVVGPMSKLPGCNPPTYGPEPASPVANCDDAGSLTSGSGNNNTSPASPSSGLGSSSSVNADDTSSKTSISAQSAVSSTALVGEPNAQGPRIATTKPSTMERQTKTHAEITSNLIAQTTPNTQIQTNPEATDAPYCPHNNCINQAFMSSDLAKPFCATYTQGTTTEESAIPTFLANCYGKTEDVSSACSCLAVPTAYTG